MLGLEAICGGAICSVPTSELSVSGNLEAIMIAGDIGTLRIYAASKEFISIATDSPPNQPFLGTLEKPISFEQSIVTANGFGEINVGYGELQLINNEGDYDSLIGAFAIDGQAVRLNVGSVIAGFMQPYATFSLLANLTATGWSIDEEFVTIFLRDNSFKLELLAQPNSYGGAGGTDGSADLTGKTKPITLGQVRNISPPLVIPAFLTYQVNDGAIQAIDAVYDAGGLLTNLGNFANVAAMNAAVISSGYVTCLAEGFFRLGASPFGKVTADVRGANAGGYVQTTADIVKFLVLNSTELTTADIDQYSLDVLNLSHPATIGYYL